MNSVGRFFLWFWLVPYFWVKSWDSRPLFGHDRQLANRVNGLIVLGLMFELAVFGVLSAIRTPPLSNVVAVLVYTAGVAIAALLLNKEREHRYLKLYQGMPTLHRRLFGLATFGAALWIAFVVLPPKSQIPKLPTCPTSAQEMTASCL
jgi:hypothetical protein